MRTSKVSARLLVVMAVIGARPVLAQQTAPDTSAITPQAVDQGRAIFHGKGTCFACHGAQLEGTQLAPTLKSHAWRDAKNGQLDELFRVVTHGVPSTVMVAYPGGISRTDALNVASYIWSVNNRNAKP
ncbi:MAG TPA: cytochrome c [Gemmatimonadaceae bacterium]|jgi:mono/diheme cytochrome c family protein